MDTPNPTTTFDGLFSGKRRFQVPSYQRAYSWQVGNGDQVGQFLKDLREQDSCHPYYLGHFLFESENASGAFLVIDGQQRLTTIVIFMSCLISECEKRGNRRLGDVETDEIRETYLKHRTQKLWTVEADEAFFRDRIVHQNERAERTTGRRSERFIAEAADFFASEMEKASDAELVSWFHLLANAVATTYTVEENKTQRPSQRSF